MSPSRYQILLEMLLTYRDELYWIIFYQIQNFMTYTILEENL